MEQSSEAIMNGKSAKNAATHCRALERRENNFSVVFKTILELKRLSVLPGNRTIEDLFFPISPVSNPYEPTLSFSLGSN